MICFVIGSRIIYTLFISIQYFSRFWRLALLRPDPGRSTQEETNTKPPVFGFTAFFHFQSTTKIITRARTFNIIETIQHDLAHDKPGKKKALEHDLAHDKTRKEKKKHALEHDLVHDKTRKKKNKRIGARFGARQTAKKKHALERGLVARDHREKRTHWSAIWCTTDREKKHAIGARFGARQSREKKTRIGAQCGARQTEKKKQQYNIYI